MGKRRIAKSQLEQKLNSETKADIIPSSPAIANTNVVCRPSVNEVEQSQKFKALLKKAKATGLEFVHFDFWS